MLKKSMIAAGVVLVLSLIIIVGDDETRDYLKKKFIT